MCAFPQTKDFSGSGCPTWGQSLALGWAPIPKVSLMPWGWCLTSEGTMYVRSGDGGSVPEQMGSWLLQ